MADKATLQRRLTAAKGWVTRCDKALTGILAQPKIHKVVLTDAIDEFDRRLNTFDSIQTDLELTIFSEDELLDSIDAAADYRDKARISRVTAATRLTELCTADGTGNVAKSHSVASVDVKLPKLTLPKFCGDVLEWQSFWDQFKASVDSTDLPVVSKFSYLLSLLQGEAKQAVQGLSMTSDHYDTACKILEDRYGRKERIIFTHIQKLLNITVPTKCSVSVLWKLNDDLQAHTRSLEALGIDGDKYGVILTPLILSRLPHDIRLEWSREGKGYESDLTYLLDFLKKEIQRRERSQMFRECISAPSAAAVSEEKRGKISTASALQSTSVSKSGMSPSCGICSKAHPTERCFKLLHCSIPQRIEKVQNSGLCFRCLKSGHIARGCSVCCEHCQGRHHIILCNPQRSSVRTSIKTDARHLSAQTDAKRQTTEFQPSDRGDRAEVVVSHTGVASVSTNRKSHPPGESRSRVLLQSARVRVQGERGVAEATVLFDTGSDRTYITSELVRKVGPEWVGTQPISYAAFGTGKASASELRNMYNVFLQDSHGSGRSLHVTEVPVICAPLWRPEVSPEVIASLGNIELVESYCSSKEVKVDILIGLDSYWNFVNPQIVNSACRGLMAQSTIFGWILYGSVPSSPAMSGIVLSHQLLCMNVCDVSLRSFWELESIGIPPHEEDSGPVDPVLHKFQEDLRKVDGRYQVALPWKPGAQEWLQDNEKLARIRLCHLTKRLVRDPALQGRYDAVIGDMCEAGIVEEVPVEERVASGPVFYMPHRPVVRESAVTTKVRPVFDASATGYNGVSLNHCMEVGPCLLTNLTEILVRFRRWQVAITADIEKAFLQVAVRSEDCDVHRFLWQVGDQVKIMRFRRVPFGNCSSPFLLNATVQFHLSTQPDSRVVRELQNNMYVDDFLSGADSVEEGCEMVKESCRIMSQASMPLVKWCSNSSQVGDMLQQDFKDKLLEAETIKVLGMSWSATEDSFFFHGTELPKDLNITKRVVLSYFSRLFDPLGFTAPFVLQAKCLFQELWSLGLEWDEELPQEFQVRFLSWIEGLRVLMQWRIPRRYVPGRWSDICHLQLHGFSDASPKAYGAAVYLTAEMPDGSMASNLVMAKSKVAPLKVVTLPRLELLGCLLSARLVQFVRKALHLSEDIEYTCWTDSMIALSWIQSSPCRWKTFVANRVCEIQKLTTVDKWSHCSGAENPADLVTRGLRAEELVSSEVWLHGPRFLIEGPVSVDSFADTECLSSLAEEAAEPSLVCSSEPCEPLFPVERWGTLTKAIRVVAWVRRFLHNLKVARADRQRGELTYSELLSARHALILSVQVHEFKEELEALRQGRSVRKSSCLYKLSPFIGNDELLRVQGRLQGAILSWDEKHPVILPKTHLALLFTRFQHRLMKHAGVSTMISALRNEFWILGVRRVAKRVKKECVSCQRQDSVPCAQPMSPLPDSRVNQAVPFAVTGLDHAGPLYCCDIPQKKFWVLLFTCAVVRAIHLEIVESLSTSETILALRRFAARRGLPRIVYSDNAKGFTASPQQLQRQFGHVAPDWRFIAPRSPWWGGWWERLIRSVKSALKKTVGSRCLTRTELETTLHEIESCVNSRPLTFVSDEADAEKPLTPAHFLLGHSEGFYGGSFGVVPELPVQDLGSRYALRKSVLDRFWDMWSSSYMRNLPPWKGAQGKCAVQVGSLVLVQNDGQPRMRWPLGVVTRVFPGRDGVIRTVEVKTSSGKLVRSVPCVRDLEIMSGSFCSSPSLEPVSESHVTRVRERSISPGGSGVPKLYVTGRGRTVKPVQRLDL